MSPRSRPSAPAQTHFPVQACRPSIPLRQAPSASLAGREVAPLVDGLVGELVGAAVLGPWDVADAELRELPLQRTGTVVQAHKMRRRDPVLPCSTTRARDRRELGKGLTLQFSVSLDYSLSLYSQRADAIRGEWGSAPRIWRAMSSESPYTCNFWTPRLAASSMPRIMPWYSATLLVVLSRYFPPLSRVSRSGRRDICQLEILFQSLKSVVYKRLTSKSPSYQGPTNEPLPLPALDSLSRLHHSTTHKVLLRRSPFHETGTESATENGMVPGEMVSVVLIQYNLRPPCTTIT